jgi:hypothetical protein
MQAQIMKLLKNNPFIHKVKKGKAIPGTDHGGP